MIWRKNENSLFTFIRIGMNANTQAICDGCKKNVMKKNSSSSSGLDCRFVDAYCEMA